MAPEKVLLKEIQRDITKGMLFEKCRDFDVQKTVAMNEVEPLVVRLERTAAYRQEGRTAHKNETV